MLTDNSYIGLFGYIRNAEIRRYANKKMQVISGTQLCRWLSRVRQKIVLLLIVNVNSKQ